ncbi:MAG: hypothetical protein KGJ13_05720 [Patescibacteria group bacterium]|nr:hypothetical protein [Patescibacteria group bacterium]
MPKEESTTIKLGHIFDFSLLAKIFLASAVVGERFMRLDTVEEASYQEVTVDDPDDESATITKTQLAASHTSGCSYFFDDDEARELEDQIKLIIKKSEEQMTQIQLLAQENAALKQELNRVVASKIQIPGFRRN